ncbi:Hsp20/alpha crystallin family protein [Halomonas sp.]|uniref:Hsp20/alpha crystallin family protein n=1 Tax=Halomonas sp. TaxID=1486246 RepID=UPI00257EF821|nr:Hsp20/alpha crystallin family protein [Halomonas sp.]MCJ8284606.1 Hsp20/alpha crystallin family protein [Halomonas sp.]NQY69660.1 Hsp20/alpha crystallin family protein [Halomonas sp.]
MNQVARHAGVAPTESAAPSVDNDSRESLLPRVDIREDAETVVLVADMPGVPRDAVSVEVQDGVLSIEGEMSLSMPDGMSSLYAELRASRYARRFTLSPEIDSEAIVAQMEHGQLTLRLPRRGSHQPRKIEVKAA